MGSNQGLPRWVWAVIIVLIVGALLWVYVIQPAVAWAAAHAVVAGAVFGSIAVLGLSALTAYYLLRKRQENREWKLELVREKKRVEARKAYEAEQKAKGLVKYVDVSEKTYWGTHEEAEEHRLLNQVVQLIKEFQPARQYRNELPYQCELCGWLKANFPLTAFELRTGSSRPDIVVGDIAIEVKGPTGRQQLDTIASKCLRYLQHWNNLIVVLFEVDVNERYYAEWEEGIKRFAQVKVVRK